MPDAAAGSASSAATAHLWNWRNQLSDWPKARRSIHEGCDSELHQGERGRGSSYLAMVKSGSRKASPINAPNNSWRRDEDGIDEVDEAVSSSDRINVLQKSPSSPCNISTDDSLNSSTEQDRNQSKSLPSTPTFESFTHPLHIFNKDERSTKTENSSIKYAILVVTSIVIILIAYLVPSLTSTSQKGRYNETDYKKDLRSMMASYNIDLMTMMQILSGVQSALEDEDVSSFVFTHKKGQIDRLQNFLLELSKATAKYLRNELDSATPVTAGVAELNHKSPKEILDGFIQEDLSENGVLVVHDLEEIKPESMKPFHYFCDRENPVVKKAAIFFTLNIDRCGNSDNIENNGYALVEKCLGEKWKTLPDHIRNPLLTRVVNIVIYNL